MEPNWEWYRSFLAVAETGSLSGAARALGLTQPTVGRHIDSLEQSLGQKLFTRSFDGFAPTAVAQDMRPYAQGLAANAAALQRVASGHGGGVRGAVRVTASEILSVEVLAPVFAQLREAYPELVIELKVSNQLDDLLLREADIAVRMVRPQQEALVAKRVGAIPIGLYAHQRYLARHGMPASLDELASHTLIGFDQENAFIRRVQQQFPFLARAQFAFRTDSDLAVLAAIRAGVGIGPCQAGLAARDAALVPVLPQAFSLPLETWIAMHEDLRDSPRCAVTFTALADGIAAYIAG